MTTENNKLIAEFMGLKSIDWYSDILKRSEKIWVRKEFNEDPTHKDDYSKNSKFDWENFWPQTNTLNYHSSWDWLMPVVDKCFSMRFEDTPGLREYSESINTLFDHLHCGLHSDINHVYRNVIEFIKWYNEK